MQLDIYRRTEHAHKLSFLAVPAGNLIPEEATNVDWITEARSIEINVDEHSLPNYGIDEAARQIREKGYAITSVTHQVEER